MWIGLWLSQAASAFCGFYVGGASADLYNDATVVTLMRDGSRTILSMQNSYEGPASAFAMVVPVPEVIGEEDVKTLPREIFARIDQLASPRLVEYWEQDPCLMMLGAAESDQMMMPVRSSAPRQEKAKDDLGVTVEASFAVGEYDIVILSAKDSGGLDTWLRQEGYNIPQGAETVLRGYVQQGTRFFVAKVDPERVTFHGDRAVLSPLRIAYDDDRFGLPVRLGLLNSSGEQDLIVHILAKNQRYEVANFPNITVPTNIRVRDGVRSDFGGFYEALFQHTVRNNPRAVVTEYAWQAGSCDPCPGPTLSYEDIATLGGDILGDSDPMTWTLTRLHARYGREGLAQDLVFKPAEPLIGGRGTPNQQGLLDEKTQKSSMNQFQGRYAILHPWTGKLSCESPSRGIWGGPPNGGQQVTAAEGRLQAGAKKPANLPALLVDTIPGLAPVPRKDPGVGIPELLE
jgi:hypothetical protein